MRKIKWGVIGTAFIADACTIPGMVEAENCERYAIAGRTLEKAQAYQAKFGFEKAYGSYDELLADENVEAVYIPLPNDLHYEWVLKAIEAGKHVLCEKPLAPNTEKVEEMIAAANKKNVLLMEAFAYLHSPIVAAIKEELDNGVIGDLRYMESAFITSDYNLTNIRMQKNKFGGCTYDLGCYTISQILWLTDQDPVKVQAIAEYSPEGVDVCTTGILTFAAGWKANFTCGMVLATEKDKRIDRLQIHGTKGCIKSNVEFNQAGELSYTVETENGVVTKTVTAPQNYRLEVEQFGRCIAEGEKPHVSNEFTVRNAKVLDKVIKSIEY